MYLFFLNLEHGMGTFGFSLENQKYSEAKFVLSGGKKNLRSRNF